jgi:hypothetical protein
MFANGWRHIETAPLDGTRILLWTRTDVEAEDRRYIESGDLEHVICAQICRWTEHTYGGGPGWEIELVGTPTHWMPLPEPPNPSSSSFVQVAT